MDSRERFIRDFEIAKMKYPFLKGSISKMRVEYPFVVKGDFPVIDTEGFHWGTFAAAVLFHISYPKGFG